jgi:pimeloyl-ACP methyl ester carboxylesterase
MNDVQMTAERPVFIPFEDGQIFAVVTTPAGPARGVGVVIAHGRGDQMTFHRNQLSKRLAGRLAEQGFHVVRFDYPGVGDSTGRSRGFALSVTQDREILRVLDELRRAGLKRYAFVGYCVGGRSALAASLAIEGVEALVLACTPLLSARSEKALLESKGKQPGTVPKANGLKASGFPRRSPLRRLAARLLARGRKYRAQASGSRLDPKVRQRLRTLVESGHPTLMVYGRDDEYALEAREVAGIASGWNASPESLRLHDSTPGIMHGFLSIAAQEAFLKIAVDWLSNIQ